jgi:hypothetical protein
MIKRQALFFAALMLGSLVAYKALDWWTAEKPVDDFRDAVADVPSTAPRPVLMAGIGIGGVPVIMPYALPPAPDRKLAKR